jgi:two-component system chemotaxis response regulator CheY
LKALVIDDSKSIRMVLIKILEEIGFEIVEAKDGLEALESLKSQGPFDVALVDWNMPEMNGFKFVSEVRKDMDYDNMKLMMVTTETETTQVVRALKAGANEYVMKPFTKEVIIEKLNLMGLTTQ